MRVGKEVQRQVLAEELRKKPVAAVEYSDEERKTLAAALMKLPKAKVAAALRSAGLFDEADAYEQQQAEEHLQEMRGEQLKRIMALPVDERLSQLIANGFTDEAKALSEQLAAEQEQAAADDAKESAADGEKPAEAVKKKGGRPKKVSK